MARHGGVGSDGPHGGRKRFRRIRSALFSTTQAGKPGPDVGGGTQPVQDANAVDQLAEMDVIVSCQGGGYTEKMHPALRTRGWDGYWIDAASTCGWRRTA
ncbi:hypothetical protein [Desulfosarcina cetonica]|uniref:hypothetical protein n=1 Tax=Desulfosarcina cetonica TaxID=90730 RepID=UPI000AF41002|nr:hypothetical protein [Desulfosarcina cetonica]